MMNLWYVEAKDPTDKSFQCVLFAESDRDIDNILKRDLNLDNIEILTQVIIDWRLPKVLLCKDIEGGLGE